MSVNRHARQFKSSVYGEERAGIRPLCLIAAEAVRGRIRRHGVAPDHHRPAGRDRIRAGLILLSCQRDARDRDVVHNVDDAALLLQQFVRVLERQDRRIGSRAVKVVASAHAVNVDDTLFLQFEDIGRGLAPVVELILRQDIRRKGILCLFRVVGRFPGRILHHCAARVGVRHIHGKRAAGGCRKLDVLTGRRVSAARQIDAAFNRHGPADQEFVPLVDRTTLCGLRVLDRAAVHRKRPRDDVHRAAIAGRRVVLERRARAHRDVSAVHLDDRAVRREALVRVVTALDRNPAKGQRAARHLDHVAAIGRIAVLARHGKARIAPQGLVRPKAPIIACGNGELPADVDVARIASQRLFRRREGLICKVGRAAVVLIVALHAVHEDDLFEDDIFGLVSRAAVEHRALVIGRKVAQVWGRALERTLGDHHAVTDPEAVCGIHGRRRQLHIVPAARLSDRPGQLDRVRVAAQVDAVRKIRAAALEDEVRGRDVDALTFAGSV